MEKAILFSDRLGKLNPGAMATRTISALSQLTSRLNEIQAIMPQIALRKELLILEKRRLKNQIAKAKTKLKLIRLHPVFKKKKQKISKYEPKFLIMGINKTLSLLQSIWIYPYYEQAYQTRFYLEKTKRLISKKNYTKANVVLNQAYEILKTKR